MSSKKNRDLAQELVDFLLDEDQKKKKAPVRDGEEPTIVPANAPVEHAQRDTAFMKSNENAKKILEEATRDESVPFFGPKEVIPQISKESTSTRSKMILNDVSNLMAGAEAVKVAQARITNLERERDQLRDETEQLLSASETLQRRYGELKAEHETLERKHREKIEILEDEKQVFKARIKAREDELEKVGAENEDLKARFQNDLRKIRVRERELEHRQEIMKAEHATVSQSKDEMIMEFKRQLERLHFELDNFRAKSADMNTKLNEYFERNHRTVKALRLALSVLEAGDGDDKKKVG